MKFDHRSQTPQKNHPNESGQILFIVVMIVIGFVLFVGWILYSIVGGVSGWVNDTLDNNFIKNKINLAVVQTTWGENPVILVEVTNKGRNAHSIDLGGQMLANITITDRTQFDSHYHYPGDGLEEYIVGQTYPYYFQLTTNAGDPWVPIPAGSTRTFTLGLNPFDGEGKAILTMTPPTPPYQICIRVDDLDDRYYHNYEYYSYKLDPNADCQLPK